MSRGPEPDAVRDVLDVLSRRGALEVFRALTGPGLSPRALLAQRGAVAESVWQQRVADLERAGLVEEVRETGDLRLSSAGRRVQGLLEQLERELSR